jgi:hypothetical protein
MPQQQPRTGVCLLRIEVHSATFLISIRQNLDISTFSGEVYHSFSEVEQAIAEVRSFLDRFVAGGPACGVGPDGADPHKPLSP